MLQCEIYSEIQLVSSKSSLVIEFDCLIQWQKFEMAASSKYKAQIIEVG